MQSSVNVAPSVWKPAQSWPVFILTTLILILVIHALVFFPHEYAHSFTAWLLGWKSNPLALDYGHLTAGNILLQSDIDENVNYSPIFAGGHGVQAAFIAVAGVLIGNAFITYPISWWGYRKAKRNNSRKWGLFFYWMYVASIGNFIDYVPVRTFASRADMYTVVSGLNISPWWIIVVLGIPFAIALILFFFRLAPAALHWLFPQSPVRRAIMVLLTAFIVFGFYGAAGWSGFDPTTHMISVISVYVFIPLMTILGWWLTDRLWVK